MEFEIEAIGQQLDADARAALLAAPGFGRIFTEHMISARWTVDSGWHEARLQPYAPLVLDPATAVLHYSQSVFEGLKAYRQPDGGVALFRPERNAARMAASCRRLALPELPQDDFVSRPILSSYVRVRSRV